jgi:hypothetical protein
MGFQSPDALRCRARFGHKWRASAGHQHVNPAQASDQVAHRRMDLGAAADVGDGRGAKDRRPVTIKELVNYGLAHLCAEFCLSRF